MYIIPEPNSEQILTDMSSGSRGMGSKKVNIFQLPLKKDFFAATLHKNAYLT